MCFTYLDKVDTVDIRPLVLENIHILEFTHELVRLVAEVVNSVLVGSEMASKVKVVSVGRSDLLPLRLEVLRPAGDRLLEFVVLKRQLSPIVDDRLDGQIELPAGLHEEVIDLLDLASWDARGTSDLLLSMNNHSLSLAALEEDFLYSSQLGG